MKYFLSVMWRHKYQSIASKSLSQITHSVETTTIETTSTAATTTYTETTAATVDL